MWSLGGPHISSGNFSRIVSVAPGVLSFLFHSWKKRPLPPSSWILYKNVPAVVFFGTGDKILGNIDLWHARGTYDFYSGFGVMSRFDVLFLAQFKCVMVWLVFEGARFSCFLHQVHILWTFSVCNQYADK